MRDAKHKDDTRTRILQAGAELLHRQGYAATGIQQVLDACGVPKGSFYHYFKSKEDFGLAVVDMHAERMLAGAQAMFANPELAPMERIRRFFERFLALFTDPGHPLATSGCPIGNMVQELAASSAAFRQRLDTVLTGMEEHMALALRQAREAGEIPAHLDPEETARFLSSSWQGAILRAKAAGNPAPLVRCRDFILNEVLRQG